MSLTNSRAVSRSGMISTRILAMLFQIAQHDCAPRFVRRPGELVRSYQREGAESISVKPISGAVASRTRRKPIADIEIDDGNPQPVVGAAAKPFAEQHSENEDKDDRHGEQDGERTPVAQEQAEVFGCENPDGHENARRANPRKWIRFAWAIISAVGAGCPVSPMAGELWTLLRKK